MKFRIRYVCSDGKVRYLHNTMNNAGVAEFTNLNDVMREVYQLACCGYAEIIIERKEA